MTTSQVLIILTIIVYLGAMLFIGAYFNRRGSGSSSADFYIGGLPKSAGQLSVSRSAHI